MAELPLVSHILCIYNVERYIEKSIRSVLGQTYGNIEFILIDDGSTDHSIDIVRSVAAEFPHLQSRIRIIRTENRGLPAARRLGISEARGEYILFSDPDDFCARSQVEKLVAKAVKEDADMVICNLWNMYPHILVPRREKRYATKKEILRALSTHHHFRGYVWNKLVRREIYLKCIDFIPPASHCEDLVLTIPAVFFSRKIVQLRDRLYFYRKRNLSSISHTDKKTRTRGTVLNTMELFMKWRPCNPSPFTGIEESFLMVVASQIYRQGLTDQFDRYPVIMETLLPIAPDLPSRRYREDMSYKDQLLLKRNLLETATAQHRGGF